MGTMGLVYLPTTSGLVPALTPYFFFDLCCNCFFYGIDGIYTFVDWLYTFDVHIIAWLYSEGIFQDALNAYCSFFETYVFTQINVGPFLAAYFDESYWNWIWNIGFEDDFLRRMSMSTYTMSTFAYHVELFPWFDKDLLVNSERFNAIFKPIVDFLFSIETLPAVIVTYPQYMFCIFVGYAFWNYSTDTLARTGTSEKVIDGEHLSATTLLDAEEEIGSVDDMLLAFANLFFIFAWFFYAYVWGAITNYPPILITIWFLPWAGFTIVFVPVNFLYGFGIAFSSFLRGASASSVFTFELLFDLIVSAALFIRLVIQGVRLILILFVYCSLHDMILYWQWNASGINANESFWRDLITLEFTLNSLAFFIFIKIPFWISYFLFEIVHTFFVVTAQFFAFFGMVFWLYFFLYTYYTFDAMEDYLTVKRLVYRGWYFFKK